MESSLGLFDESTAEISARLVPTLIEISEIYHSRNRLSSPRYRLCALLAILSTARRFAIRTTAMERKAMALLQEITSAKFLRRRHADIGASVRYLLPRSIHTDLAPSHVGQRLVRSLFLPGPRAVALVVETLCDRCTVLALACHQAASWLRHLRNQLGALRAAVLEAIEESFCRPLGIRRIGIANRHSGYGKMPSSYRQEERTFERWRALKIHGRRVKNCYDDLSTTVNQPIWVRHVYWRTIDDGPVPGKNPC